MEGRPARQVVRLAVHVVVDQSVVDRLQVELDATLSSGVDEDVEDAQAQVAVVAGAHERRRHRVGVAQEIGRRRHLQQHQQCLCFYTDVQESPANAKGTRDRSACMKAHCEHSVTACLCFYTDVKVVKGCVCVSLSREPNPELRSVTWHVASHRESYILAC